MSSGADTLVDVLRVSGVRRVYGVPGEHCLGLVDSIGRSSDVEFVASRHEGGAAYMAEAEAKLTGRLGVCLGSAAVGAANLAIGIHTARQDSSPVLALVGQTATAWRHREAWQEVDLAAAFAPYAKATVEVPRADRIAELTVNAVRTAISGRPGPVVVVLPDDVQLQPDPSDPVLSAPRTPRPTLTDLDAASIVDSMREARHPLILLGGGTKNYAAAAELSALAAATTARVVTGFRRHDSFPNDDPAFVGTLSLRPADEVTQALREADLILALGTRLSELTTLRYTFPDSGQRLVHIDPSAEVLANSFLARADTYLADPQLAAAALARVAGTAATPVAPTAAAVAGAAAEDDPISSVARQLDRLLTTDAIVTGDAGDFYPPFAGAISYRAQRRYLGPTSGAMGYALPAAVAAAMTEPARQVVALAGDGGFMMSLPELETAVRHRLNITVLVVNNQSYGSIRRHQTQRYDGRHVGVDFQHQSFATIARAFGADGAEIDADTFGQAFIAAQQSAGPSVLELHVPRTGFGGETA